jgi:hypothetical protein
MTDEGNRTDFGKRQEEDHGRGVRGHAPPAVCRMTVRPGGDVIEWAVRPGDTYEDALLANCIVPDTVLIFFKGTSLPQDKPITEPDVEIVLTCSRG